MGMFMDMFDEEIQACQASIAIFSWMRSRTFHIVVLVLAVYWHAADEEARQEPGWFPGRPCSNSASSGMVGWFVGRPCSDDALDDLTSCDANAVPNLACAFARVKATCLEDDASYTWANCAGQMSMAKVLDLIDLLPHGNHTEQPTAAEGAAHGDLKYLKNRKKRVLREMKSLKAYMGLFKLPGVVEAPMILLNMLALYALWSGICIFLIGFCLRDVFVCGCIKILFIIGLVIVPLGLLIEACTARNGRSELSLQ